MSMAAVLFAHERPGVGRAVEAILRLHGFEVTLVRHGDEAQRALQSRRFAALVLDVGLPGVAAYELAEQAKAMTAEHADRGADAVVLVASVYRRTSYKRRPARLYGADDYVEIHHLGDMLPDKLRALVPAAGPAPEADVLAGAQKAVARALEQEGDERLATPDLDRLAALIVADVLLYNGDRIVGCSDLESVRTAVQDELALAADLLDEVARAGGRAGDGGPDPIGRAFDRLMTAMGRSGEGS